MIAEDEVLVAGLEEPLSDSRMRSLLIHIIDVMRESAEQRGGQKTLAALQGDSGQIADDIIDGKYKGAEDETQMV